MADEADMTQDRMEREAALRRRFVPQDELQPCGICAYCGADVAHPKKFCDAECAEGWEFEKRMRGGRK